MMSNSNSQMMNTALFVLVGCSVFLSIRLIYVATHYDTSNSNSNSNMEDNNYPVIPQFDPVEDNDEKMAALKNTVNMKKVQIEDFPFEPILRPDCEVISSSQKYLCFKTQQRPHFADLNRTISVIRRTLEYIFQCDATNLLLIQSHDIPKENCFQWLTNTDDPAYLIPFLYQYFHYLPTTQINISRKICTTSTSQTSYTQNHTIDQQKQIQYQIQYKSPYQPWAHFYDHLRYCDYVALQQNDFHLHLAASSLGIPTLNIQHIANLSLYPKQPRAWAFHYLNYTRANAILQTFPVHLFTTTTKQKLNKSDQKSSPPSNRTLVILLGSLRGGEVTWKTLYDHVLDLNHADLALMIGKDVQRANSSLYQRAKFIWEFNEYTDWGEPIDQIWGTTWRNTVFPFTSEPKGLFGGVSGRISSTAITFMARYWLREILINEGIQNQYDRFVVSRSDQFYTCAHDLSQLSPQYIWVPSGEDYGGITDRHFVCHRSHIIKALDMYPHFLKNPDKYIVWDRKLKDNAEQMMRRRWIEQGIYRHTRRFPRVMFAAALPTDKSSRWRKISFADLRTSEGVVAKYILEYKVSQCVCLGDAIYVKPQRMVDPVQQLYYDCVNSSKLPQEAR